MKTVWYINDDQTSVKKVKEMVGENRYERMLTEAKKEFNEDPYIENSWYIGSGNYLTVEFQI